MIVPMKKITILTTEDDASHAVGLLRKLGLLHIKHLQKPHAEYISATEHKLENLNKALEVMKDMGAVSPEIDKDTLIEYQKEITTLGQRRQEYLGQQEELEKQLKWFSEWVVIDKQTIQDLEERGVFLKLYICNKNSQWKMYLYC